MPLKLRPSGLGSGIDKDRPDYTVLTGEWEVGRIYETRGGPDNLRWFWSLSVNGPMTRAGRVATLQDAKVKRSSSSSAFSTISCGSKNRSTRTFFSSPTRTNGLGTLAHRATYLSASRFKECPSLAPGGSRRRLTVGSLSHSEPRLTFHCAGRARSHRPNRRLRPGRGIKLMSVTKRAPPRRRSSTILRLWKASSSGR